MSETTDTPQVARVRALVTPVVADLGVELYDLDMRSGTLRITLDTPAGSTGGIDLDQIALATRLISKELDEADPIPGRYTLEVSSPGLERTLRTPGHFRRVIGSMVNVRLRDVVNDQRRVQGVLESADDTSIVVRVGDEAREIALEQIDRARTVYDWTPKPKPGKGPRRRTPSATSPAPSTTDTSTTDLPALDETEMR